MAYTKQTWHDMPTTDTPIDATHLGVLEQGVFDASTAAAAALAAGAGLQAYADAKAITGVTATLTTTATATVGKLHPVDATSAPFTVTLPSPVGIAGSQMAFRKLDVTGNAVTLSGLIDGGSSTLVLAGLLTGQSVELLSDGTTWRTKRLPLADLSSTYAPANPAARDSFAGKPDGALTVTDSGHAWISRGAGTTNPLPGIVGGALGLLGPLTVDNTAWYAVLDMGTQCARITAEFTFTAGGVNSCIALGAWGDSNRTTDAAMHLIITPTYATASAWQGGVGLVDLTPMGKLAPLQRFAVPLTCDGVTKYSVQIDLDFRTGTAYIQLPDGQSISVSSPYIKAANSRFPFWEMAQSHMIDVVGTFSKIGAEVNAPSVIAPQASHRAVARVADTTRNGAGPTVNRPPSAQHPGMTWYDTTTGRLTYSDGVNWRDVLLGTIVGNLLTPDQATLTIDISGWLPAYQSTVARVTTPAPFGRASALKVTATVAGASWASPNTFINTVVPGDTLSATAYVLGAPARTCHARIDWYTAATGYISASTGADFTPSTTAWSKMPVVSGVAPALAAKGSLVLVFNTTTIGDVNYVCQAALASGVIADYIEP